MIRSGEAVGTTEHEYEVLTNDPRRAVLKLVLRANVRPLPEYVKRIGRIDLARGEEIGPLVAWPTAHPVIALERGERFTLALRFRPRDAAFSPVKVLPGDLYKLREEENGSGWWVETELGPYDETGNMLRDLKIEHDPPSSDSVTVTVAVTVIESSVVVSHESIDLGSFPVARLKGEPPRLGRIGIRKLIGSFKLVRATTDLAFLRLTPVTVVDGMNYVIEIRSVETPPGSYSGKIVLETDDARRPRVEVPCTLVVTEN